MEKYAIIKSGSNQYLVSEKQALEVEKIDSQAGKQIEFNQILLVSADQQLFIGQPLVKNAKVTAQVKGQIKDKKISVIKFRAKSRYRRKTGHRQVKTQLVIKNIILPGNRVREK